MGLKKKGREKGREQRGGGREIERNATSTTQRTLACSPLKQTALNIELQRSSCHSVFEGRGSQNEWEGPYTTKKLMCALLFSLLLQSLDLGQKKIYGGEQGEELASQLISLA